MEMDVQVNHKLCCIEDDSSDRELSPEAPGLSDAFRDPELLPRVGDQYQVQIPSFITRPAYLLQIECQMDASLLGTFHSFLVGLPISIMWISEEVEDIKHEPQEILGDLADISSRNVNVKSESSGEVQTSREADSRAKVEPAGISMGGGVEEESAKLHLQLQTETEMHQKHGGKGYCLVPGTLSNSWTELEVASFLLGLYIFGKNLVQVKKFIESKSLGDILSFYYGKFYNSDSYRIWSQLRKLRNNRRCIFGERIFMGWRQQELLSRLFQYLPEESQINVLEVAKMFGEGKLSLEEFVSTLKTTVGLNALIEAVGIGKGKQDLTGIAMESLKLNQVATVRPEIPTGKACSSLSPLEIINFLTGGYRLSKARSNDLFWEAVWPRLLARGWHSEQPNDYVVGFGSRNPLVFLMPGVKKFSRRKLVKGDHYFDSITDVLNKVALDPTLLELDIGSDKGEDNKEENGWANETHLNQKEFPSQQRHCYLKPRTPSCSTDANAMKFTVVDTSLANGEVTKVRELRSLPVELRNISLSSSDSEESDEDSSREQTDESDFDDKKETSTSKPTKISFDKRVSSDREDVGDNSSKQGLLLNGSCFNKDPVKIPKDLKVGKSDETQPRNPIKCPTVRKVKPGDGSLLASVKGRQRFTARGPTEKSHSKVNDLASSKLKQNEGGVRVGNPDFKAGTLSCMELPQEKLSSTGFSPRGSPNATDGCILGSNSGAELANDESQSWTLIDLNIPISQDAETELSTTEVAERQHDQTSRQPEDPGTLETSNSVCDDSTSDRQNDRTSSQPEDLGSTKTSVPVCDSTSEQPPNMHYRRQSTRNRPLTTKALEALACGLISIKPKRKNRDDPLENSLSRPSRRARSKVRNTENIGTATMDLEDERGNVVCKIDDLLSEP